jgi:cytochrome c-type biogenesis protein CcmE
MKPKHKRLTFVAVSVVLFGIAAGLVLWNLNDSIVFFLSPSEVVAKAPAAGQRLRIGGLVEAGSVKKDGGTVAFRVTDMTQAVAVSYRGLLPDLFREGQGVVVEGRWQNGAFVADEVLAKHDEKYMPPEVAEALKKSGRWQEQAGKTP